MRERNRRLVALLIALLITGAGAFYESRQQKPSTEYNSVQSVSVTSGTSPAAQTLAQLEVKGRAPKTGYERKAFSSGWAEMPGCDMRNYILKRDMTGVITRSDADCTVMQGTLLDPYTANTITFVKGDESSDDVQIDHVVSLSNSWQTGAQQLSQEQRFNLANDGLNLLAVDGPTNQKKGDSDAATWLPPNKEYRCRFVARQIAVKQKYQLWVTPAERDSMAQVLSTCPEQVLPVIIS